ncbi:MAG: SDR family oxidoreductase [Pseudomonadales bacterium]
MARVTLITGVSHGLGRALAEAFLSCGDIVVGISRTPGEDLAISESGSKYLHIQTDVAVASEVANAFGQVSKDIGRLDVLFNNAAVYPRVSFLDESTEDWANTVAINLNGVANCCKAALPMMIQAGSGRIFNVGSFADVSPIERSAAYSSSKGAVHALTKAIQADIASLGLDIGVHEWVPGHLRTQMSSFTGIDPEIAAQWATQIVSGSPAGTSKLYVNDAEHREPKRIIHRIVDTLAFWRSIE